jgi:hypothetical protein
MSTTSANQPIPPEVSTPTLSEIFFGKLGQRFRGLARARKCGLLNKEASGRAAPAQRLETLEPRLLLSADTIVPGLTDALQDGLAGNPDDGFGDVLQDLIEGEDYFDNNVPGVRFDDVESGIAHPTVQQTLELDDSQEGFASLALVLSTWLVTLTAEHQWQRF